MYGSDQLAARPRVAEARLQNPFLVTLAVAALYLVLLAWLWAHFHGDPMGFVHAGTVFSEGDPNGTRGYDGQFYYYTALDPSTAAAHMDNATFRLQRIFYPLLIIAVSFGQASLIPYAMIAINYLSVIGGTLLVALLLDRWGRSPWFALGYSLCAGIPVALTFDTAEPLAFALVALGVYLWDRADPWINRPDLSSAETASAAGPAAPAIRRSPAYWPLMVGGALAFAASLLTRELALYFVAGYIAVAAYLIGKSAIVRQFGHAKAPTREFVSRTVSAEGPVLLLAIGAFLPVTVWSAYLSFSAHYLGVSFAQPFEYIPFLAYTLQLSPPSLRSAALALQYMIPAALFGLLGIWRLIVTWRGPTPLLIALLGSVHLMTFLPRLGYQHQVATSRYLLGLALAAVLWAGVAKPRWILWLTLIFLLSFLAFFYGLVRQDPAYLW